jgi:hypothetical protein
VQLEAQDEHQCGWCFCWKKRRKHKINTSIADGTVEILLEKLRKCVLTEQLILWHSFNVVLSGYNDCRWWNLLNYAKFIERLLIKGELGHSISNVNVIAFVLALRTRTRAGNFLISNPLVLSFWHAWNNSTEELSHELNSMTRVRERTIPTERPPLVGEVSAHSCS